MSPLSFAPGDIVKMKNNSRLKFQFRWSGPYFIVNKGPNDVYYLERPDGTILENPVNGDYLDYFTPEDPEYYYDGNVART